MDRVVEVKVNGSYLTKDNQVAGVQGEANSTALRIEFDEGWDGFAKTITWYNAKGENPTSRVLTVDILEDITASQRIYLTLIPAEALTTAGKCMFVIDGYVNGKRRKSVYAEMVVKAAPQGVDTTVSDPTPSQAEQLQYQIEEIKQTIVNVTDAKEYSAEKAELAGTHALTSESWAVGQKNGKDVEKTDPTYQNNAKYWSQISMAEEPKRQENENVRISNENVRITNEEGRVTAETARDTAEKERDEAEKQRAAAYPSVIQTVTDAAASATDAAASAQAAKAALEQSIVKNPGSTVIDPTLSIAGAAAEAAAVGQLKQDFDAVYSGGLKNVLVNQTMGICWNGGVGDKAYKSANPDRMCNETPVYLGNNEYMIQIASGFRTSYRTVDTDGTIIADSGWITKDTEFTSDASYLYCFNTDKNFNETNLDELYQNVKIFKKSNFIERCKYATDKRSVPSAISIGNTGKKPNIDTQGRTLTFYADTRIWYDGQQYVLDSDVTVSFTSESTLWVVYFDSESKAIETCTYYQYNSKTDLNYVLLAICRLIGNNKAYLTISCDYTVTNNEKPSANIENYILLGIVPPANSPYISIDTKNKTITFPADTSIFDYVSDSGENRNRYNITQKTDISYVGTGAYLNMLVYNISSSSIRCISYYASISWDDRLIAVFRASPFVITISCPYKVDGNMYGIDIGYYDVMRKSVVTMMSNMKAVAHRGLSYQAPENTLVAYKLARENGFVYAETDVRFTSDGIAVLLHDETLNRTARNTDGTELSDTVNIADITYEQALAYDFGVWKSSEFAGTKIPTLEEFVSLCKKIGMTPRIELCVYTTEAMKAVTDIVQKYGMKEHCEINCNNVSLLEQAKNAYKGFPLVYGAGSTVDVASMLGALKSDYNHVIWNIYYGNVTDDIVTACIENDVELEVWTVDSESQILSLNPYISGVTSNSINASVLMQKNS